MPRKAAIYPKDDSESVFNLRIPRWLVEKVDTIRKERPGKISRNTWILEAIEDKVEDYENSKQGE